MSHQKVQRIPLPKLDGIPTTVSGEKFARAVVYLVRALRESVGRQHLRAALAAFYQGFGLHRDLADGHLALVEHYLNHSESRWVNPD